MGNSSKCREVLVSTFFLVFPMIFFFQTKCFDVDHRLSRSSLNPKNQTRHQMDKIRGGGSDLSRKNKYHSRVNTLLALRMHNKITIILTTIPKKKKNSKGQTIILITISTPQKKIKRKDTFRLVRCRHTLLKR